MRQRTYSNASNKTDDSDYRTYRSNSFDITSIPNTSYSLNPSLSNLQDKVKSIQDENIIEAENDSSTLPPVKMKIHYSYWIMLASFLLLFLAYSSAQNLASSLVGRAGFVSIAILYFFYIISNLLAPTFLYIFNNNCTLMMFIGSITYTIFISAFVFAVFGHVWTLYPTAVIVGSAGGLVWVGNGVYITNIAIHSAKIAVEEERKEKGDDDTHHNVYTIEESYENNIELVDLDYEPEKSEPVLLEYNYEAHPLYTKVKGSALSFAMTFQWVAMQSNLVIGATIAFFILGGASSSGTQVEADLGNIRILFVVLFIVACIANISFYVLNKSSIPVDPITDLNSNTHMNTHLKTSSATNDTDSNDLPSDPSDLSVLPHRLSSSLLTILSSVKETLINCVKASKNKCVYLCIPQYMSAAMLINLQFSIFNAHATKNLLGSANVPISMIFICSCDITGAFIASPFIKTLRSSRITAIVGFAIQLSALLIMLIFDYKDIPSTTDNGRGGVYQWMYIIVCSVIAGLGDGIQAGGTNTTIGQLGGEDPKVRTIVFSVLNVWKGLGSVFIFAFGSSLGYKTIILIVAIVVALSIVGQILALNSGCDRVVLDADQGYEQYNDENDSETVIQEIFSGMEDDV